MNRLNARKPFFRDLYLTKRETDVLKYVVLGYTSKQIGKVLKISFRTIEFYIETLKIKLNCESKGKISEVAIKTGLIGQLNFLE